MAKTRDNQTLTKVIGLPLEKSISRSEGGNVRVVGKFTSDNVDEWGDIITREATEGAVDEYRQWANIRYMHQPRPVGKAIKIGAADGLEWNEVEIEVIDEQAAKEVEAGLLSALSVGIVFGWDDFEQLEEGGWKINAYKLAEISLVDHPANYDAKLDLAATPSKVLEAMHTDGLQVAIKSFEVLGNGEGLTFEKDADAEDEEATEMERSPACRQEGESEADCVARKIPEILEENPDMEQEQAVAIAHSMCAEACSDKAMGEDKPEKEAELDIPEEGEIEESVKELSAEDTETVIEDEMTLELNAEDLNQEDLTMDAEEAEEVAIDIPEQVEVEFVTKEVFDSFKEEIVQELGILSATLTELLDLAKEAEVDTEVFVDEPELQEQAVDEIPEQDKAVDEEQEEDQELVDETEQVDPVLETLQSLVDKVDALTEELEELKKPVDRRSVVRTFEEEDVSEQTDTEEEMPVRDYRSSIRRYLSDKRK